MYRYEKMLRRHAEQYDFEVCVSDRYGDGYEVEVWSGESGFYFWATDCHTSITNQGSFPELSPAGIWKRAWDDVKDIEPCTEDCTNRVA